MSGLLLDVRHALRSFGRAPGFFLVAVLTLGAGIGASSAVFSVGDAVLLRPLPYEAPERLAVVWSERATAGQARLLVSPADYLDWREGSGSFEELGAWTEAFFNVGGGPEPERVGGLLATPSVLTALGVQPVLGRLLEPRDAEASAGCTALVGHGLWTRRFGGDPRLVGRSVSIDGTPCTVAGVLPASLELPDAAAPALILPWGPAEAQRQARGARYLTVLGRLRPEASLQAARAELEALAARAARNWPQTNAGLGVRLVPLHEELVGEVRPALLVLLGAVGLVLLVACVNLAHLLLARAVSRQHEMSVRAALGASRWRLVRLGLIESGLLAAAGGATGVLLALWGVDGLLALAPADLPRAPEVRIDARVLAFAAALSAATGLLFGLVPAVRAAGAGGAALPGGRPQAGSRTSSRSRRALVAAEVALSVVLLAGAGLLLRSFSRLVEVDPGFDAAHVLTADLSLPRSYAEPRERAAFFEALLERVRELPGVEAAGVTSHLPLSGEDGSRAFRIEGAPGEQDRLLTGYRRISPGYAEAMGIPLLRGRDLTPRDGVEAPGAVLVNEAFARRHFPGQDPLGRRLLVEDAPDAAPRTIVGVLGDVRHSALGAAPRPELYVSHLQRPWPNMTLAVRTPGTPAALAADVRRAIAALDPLLPVSNLGPMQRHLARSVGRQRFSTLLVGLFAATALALAALGIHGVLAWSVAQRTQEIGIRLALGARRADVLRLVVGQGMAPVLAGLAAGLALALALGPLLQGLLFGVSAADPSTLTAVAALLGAVALASCALPARRAARVDPMTALRSE